MKLGDESHEMNSSTKGGKVSCFAAALKAARSAGGESKGAPSVSMLSFDQLELGRFQVVVFTHHKSVLAKVFSWAHNKFGRDPRVSLRRGGDYFRSSRRGKVPREGNRRICEEGSGP